MDDQITLGHFVTDSNSGDREGALKGRKLGQRSQHGTLRTGILPGLQKDSPAWKQETE